jgi:transcriptional regulator with XRE-family HTH domain
MSQSGKRSYGFFRETFVVCCMYKQETFQVAPKSNHQLGEYIRRRRQAIHMSLRQLAERSGYPHGSMSLIENGLRMPTPETLQRIAEALELDYEDLLVLSGVSKPEKLPTLDAYLRTRYRDELTATDRRSLERYFDELRSKKRGRRRAD